MQTCTNKPRNLDHCTCTSETCERKGMCCDCVANHRAAGNLPSCLRPKD